ncbi:hypothetical protein ACQ3I4_15825 [Zafaria sp. Z1313]|uniref:hypothetical protein n=1 Tax=unclassified Zafaria TaxID=2828765 RepID=UPI002E7771A7|nr:hypothetical protein [Zafaria sp. J156]MEE1622082.1 hypothetical protein [Zafaria sp. J156]
MEYVQVLLPTIVVALIFWFVVRSLFRVDRNERLAEAEADARAGGGTGVVPGSSTGAAASDEDAEDARPSDAAGPRDADDAGSARP